VGEEDRRTLLEVGKAVSVVQVPEWWCLEEVVGRYNLLEDHKAKQPVQEFEHQNSLVVVVDHYTPRKEYMKTSFLVWKEDWHEYPVEVDHYTQLEVCMVMMLVPGFESLQADHYTLQKEYTKIPSPVSKEGRHAYPVEADQCIQLEDHKITILVLQVLRMKVVVGLYTHLVDDTEKLVWLARQSGDWDYYQVAEDHYTPP
jgi:hypothetical protein